jgi:hypothetical protein
MEDSQWLPSGNLEKERFAPDDKPTSRRFLWTTREMREGFRAKVSSDCFPDWHFS